MATAEQNTYKDQAALRRSALQPGLAASYVEDSGGCSAAHEQKGDLEQARKLLDAICQHGLSAAERLPALIRLQEFWCANRQGVSEPACDKALLDQFLQVSEYMCDWRLRIELLEFAKHCYPDSAVQYALQQSYSYYKLGDVSMAQSCLWSLLFHQPHHSELLCSYQYLQQWSQNSGVWCVDAAISLVPLELHHEADFFWQFDDNISELCNLPDFITDWDWSAWVENNQAEEHKHLFAIMHQQWGFIGSVSLEVHRNTGFFYYWLGDDFQAQGLGPRVVKSLLSLGRQQLGMSSCYAKVYNHNLASIKALQKIGFDLLPFTARQPYDNELFFYCGEQGASAVQHQQLSQLLKDINSEIKLLGIYRV